MSNKNLSKSNIILCITSVFLMILFIISFTKINSNNVLKDKRKPVKTAVINPKNIDKITRMQIYEGNGDSKIITLIKINNLWYTDTDPFIKNSQNQDKMDFLIPAEQIKVSQMLEYFSQTINVYKRSEKLKEKNDFGLTDSSTIHLRYYMDGEIFNEVLFGKTDFAKTSRYMMSKTNTTVYEISTNIDQFLTMVEQNWTEPYIISQVILGKINASDIQKIKITEYENENQFTKLLVPSDERFLQISSKLLELRHGGKGKIIENENESSPVLKLEYELGNKCSITQIFYPVERTSENDVTEYTIITKYSKPEHKTVRNVSYKISAWTFDKIIELTD